MMDKYEARLKQVNARIDELRIAKRLMHKEINKAWERIYDLRDEITISLLNAER